MVLNMEGTVISSLLWQKWQKALRIDLNDWKMKWLIIGGILDKL